MRMTSGLGTGVKKKNDSGVGTAIKSTNQQSTATGNKSVNNGIKPQTQGSLTSIINSKYTGNNATGTGVTTKPQSGGLSSLISPNAMKGVLDLTGYQPTQPNGQPATPTNQGGGAIHASRENISGNRILRPTPEETPQYEYQPVPEGAGQRGQISASRENIPGNRILRDQGNDYWLRGIGSETQSKLEGYKDYEPSQRVLDAQAALQQVEGNRPDPYNSKYQPQIDEILNQINNRDPFNYSFADDELFRYYADLYTTKGQQASADTMAQAAGLTGGYGNSYAASVGNQAYQQYLTDLYDKGLDFQQLAYQRYQDETADRYNRLNAFNNADATDYARYRDTYGDWLTDRDYANAAEQRDYNRDYSDWASDRDYWTQLAQNQNQDYWTAQNFDENRRQFDENLGENRRQFDENLGENRRQFDLNYGENQRQFDENMGENRRQFDLNFGEGQRQFDQNLGLNYAQLGENARQFDTTMGENARQFDLNFGENQRQFDTNFGENQRQFDQNYILNQAAQDEEQRQFDAKLAQAYVTSILSMGQMPSAELLAAAGLSEEDAAKLLVMIEQTSSSAGPRKGSDQEEQEQSQVDPNALTFKEANLLENADAIAQQMGYENMDEAIEDMKKAEEEEEFIPITDKEGILQNMRNKFGTTPTFPIFK